MHQQRNGIATRTTTTTTTSTNTSSSTTITTTTTTSTTTTTTVLPSTTRKREKSHLSCDQPVDQATRKSEEETHSSWAFSLGMDRIWMREAAAATSLSANFFFHNAAAELIERTMQGDSDEANEEVVDKQGRLESY